MRYPQDFVRPRTAFTAAVRIHCDAPFGFPFGHIANLMQKLDDERRLIVLRRAMDAWQAPQGMKSKLGTMTSGSASIITTLAYLLRFKRVVLVDVIVLSAL